MAVIAPTIVMVTDPGVNRVYVATWAAIGDADTCTAIPMSGASDRSVQFSGTFASATVLLNGSNDGTNYIVLTDPQGNAISKTSASIEQIMELTRFIKPSTSGGSGSAVTVSVLLKGQV